MTRIRISIAAVLTIGAFAPLGAQCPDGTPPPCDGRRSAALTPAPKRVNPPLDDKTWIVLPFNNVTHAPDSDWLSDASVNMLSMDLSRWQDVHVIDDRRVADFMREVPGVKGQKLSFNDGVAVAKRAGAGRLVIGDVLKVGSKTTITATVFNVRDGKQLRSAREETAIADSLMPLFGKLARGILAVPATDANVGSVGTTRADAYKEYVTGVQALNRFDATAAKQHFEAAIKLDTAFALAHYKWSIAALYDETAGRARSAQVKVNDLNNISNVMEDPDRIAHAKAAARLSATLPPRERTLITGLLALNTHDVTRACAAYGSLVRADSSDVEALYGYGNCIIQDDMVEYVVPGDPSRVRFRSDWTSGLRAFRRAVLVDPTFHLAFDPIVSILTAPLRGGCIRHEAPDTCADTSNHLRYVGDLTRVGDSLVATPRGPFKSVLDVLIESSKATTPRANVEAARIAASDWAAAGPTEGLAHLHLAKLLLRLGRPVDAEKEIAEAMLDLALKGDNDIYMQRLDVAIKLNRGALVNRLIDSLRIVVPGELGTASYAGLATMTGRMRSMDSVYVSMFAAASPPPPAAVVALINQVARITPGVAGDTLASLERVLLTRLGPGATCGGGCLPLISTGYMLALRLPRIWIPLGPDAAAEPRLLPALALAKNDTAMLRVAALRLDSASKHHARLGIREDGSTVIAADAYLALHDSVPALAAARRLSDTTLMVTGVDGLIGIGPAASAALWPRMMLLRADLEAAMPTGDKAIAKDLYGKFLDLWVNADAEFAALIARVKAARDKIGK